MKTMFNRFINTISLLVVCLLMLASKAYAAEEVGSVEDSVTRGLRGGLKAAELPLRVARERAEDLYIYNGGATLGNAVHMISKSGNPETSDNEYIEELILCNTYVIKATFVSSSFDSDEITGISTISLPKPLLGAVIYLVPVYDPNDYMVTTWECVTNFTLGNDMFKGDTGAGVDIDGAATTSTRSILTKYTDDPILEKCIYASGTIWNNIKSSIDCDTA